MRRVRMGNLLLQRGLLIYILAPESCDSYMIFYNNYEFCSFVFVWSYQQITCLMMLATDGHRVAGCMLALAFEAL